MKRTAAVIVTYNRKAMLQRCLRALCTQSIMPARTARPNWWRS